MASFSDEWERLVTAPVAGKLSARNIYDGVKEAVVDPVVSDIKDAYWIQRAARERYPAADAALNFIPTPLGAAVGVAANVDDAVHGVIAKEPRSVAGSVATGALDASRATSAFKNGVEAIKDVARKSPKMAGRAAVLLGAGPVAYVRSVNADQEKAGDKYGEIPIKEIADRMKQENSEYLEAWKEKAE